MSKQSEAKKRQGYVVKPFVKKCSNCKAFAFDVAFPGWVRVKSDSDDELLKMGYVKYETNFHCYIGGFAVKKTAVCGEWEEK